MAEQEAIGLLEQLARDFNVRDPRKLLFPDRRDLTSARAAAALRGDVARQVLAPKPRSLGKSAAEGPTTGCRRTWWTSARTREGGTSTAWWSKTSSPGRLPRRPCPTSGRKR